VFFFKPYATQGVFSQSKNENFSALI